MAEALTPASLTDIAAFEHEWAVLRECASPVCEKDRLLKLFPGVDWHRLLLVAEEHGVLAHLGVCLSDRDAPAVPPEFKQTILERGRAQNFLTLRLIGELFRLLELFVSHGISALVIKGPVLAVRAYSDPSVRKYVDLDLLVRQRDIRRATEALIASGYRAAVSLEAIDAGRIPGQYLFSKADSNLIVELHNDSTLRYFPRPLPIEDFFARQICVHVDSRDIFASSVEDELVLICVHGAKHFWERLSWIADVAGLVSRQANIDWEHAAASARTVRAEHLLHAGLQLAEGVLGVKLPEPIESRAREDASAAKLAARVLRWLPAAGAAPLGLFERATFRMRMRGGLLTGPAYLLRLSLSLTEEDWQVDERISNHHLLDILRRPFRLARKYGHNKKN